MRKAPSTTASGVVSARSSPSSLLRLRQFPYEARLASSKSEIESALRLRFAVFNLELNEGLDSAYHVGRDEDEFDSVCDHLIVEHLPTASVIGTYRLQLGNTAKRNFGYYSEREFDFAPYERLRSEVIELGRACIHREHRSSDVLYLLWRGIARYAVMKRARHLIGCSSLTSRDAVEGTAVYDRLQDWLVSEQFRTVPQREYAMPLLRCGEAKPEVPKLLRTYLAIGAKICGPPAIDRDFKTIDFLTLLDLHELHPRMRRRFMPASAQQS